jgi:hypothetical protein
MARKKRHTTPVPQQLVHPHAAGIDCGATQHFVAVPPDRDPQPVRAFRTGYRFKPGHPASSMACRKGLTTLPGQRQRVDL